MADKKISQLTGASTPLAGTEVLPIVQSGSTVKVSSDDLTVKNVRSNATSGILQIAGPGVGTTRTMTTPDANFTAARTDAAQTFTGDQTFSTVLATTFDTNVAAAGVTLVGTTLSADGTDANIDISVTPKGTGSVNITKANIDGGTVDGTVIGGSSAAAGTFTATTANSFALSTTQSVITGGMWYQTTGGKLVFTPPSTGGVKWNNYANTVEIASLDNAGKFTVADNVVIGTAAKGIEYSTTAGFYESSGGWSFKLNGTADTIKFTAAGNIECIRRTNSNAAFQVVTTNSNNAGWNAAGAVQLVSNDLSTGRSINCTGTVNQNGADYAEYMTKSGDFEIAKGDVCGVDSNGKLTKTFSEAITFVVKSTDPGLVGGDQWGVGVADDPVALEEERKKVDRIAFCGQVPVNVLNAQPGQYIVPVDDNGVIKGQAVSDPTFEQYRVAVGKVIAIEADGRAKIIVKIS